MTGLFQSERANVPCRKKSNNQQISQNSFLWDTKISDGISFPSDGQQWKTFADEVSPGV